MAKRTRKKAPASTSAEWATARVATSLVKRASVMRDLLLSKGQDALPPKLRDVVEIPAGDRKAALRRFGIGQVLDLAMTSLEQSVDGRK